MSSRFADPTTMRTRSPIYYDESPKRPPPSPSSKAPPPKKLDAKSRAVSEEPCPPKVLQAVIAPQSEPLPESCTDKSLSKLPVIDMEVFKQILELDEGDDHEFSESMVEEYLDQAQSIIESMDKSFIKRDLVQLGKHGHFLKGSSAALGVVHVQEICEKIQHLGNRIDRDKEPPVELSAEDALARIRPLLTRLNDEHVAAKNFLEEFIAKAHV